VIAPGDFVSYSTKSLRQGSTYRLEVISPDGHALPYREEIFKADAKKEPIRRLQFPFSDPPGNWKLVLTDIATGLSTERLVSIK